MTNVIPFRLPRETRFEEDDHEMGVPGGEPKPEDPMDDSDEPAQGMNSHALWEEYRDLRNQIDDEGAASLNIKWAWPRVLELEAEIKARLSPSLIDITAPVAMPEGRV